jgi:hypothetical protein
MRRSFLLVALPVVALITFSSRLPDTSAQSPLLQQVNWTSCKDVADTECVFIDVPADPGNPAGATIALRIARVPAMDQSQKKGMLLIVPGGPGVGIADTFGGNRVRWHIDDLARQFDTGGYRSELRALVDASGSVIGYGFVDPPLGGPGLTVTFRDDSQGQPQLVLTAQGETPDAEAPDIAHGSGAPANTYIFRRP